MVEFCHLKGRGHISAHCFLALMTLLLVASCCCAGCGNKGTSEYKVNGMTFDFNGQPYLVANVRGTVVSVITKGETTDVKIRLQSFQLMQNPAEDKPGVDYRNREIVIESLRPPEGLEAGKTMDASVRIVHTAKDVKFLGMSIRVS